MTDPRHRFLALLDEHGRMLRPLLRAYAWTGTDRADLEQEVLAALWSAFPRWDAARPFGTWMTRIALNVAITRARRRRWRETEPLPDDGLGPAAVEPEPVDPRLAELRVLVAELEPLDRSVLLLVLEGRSQADVADVLGLTETNVSTKVHRLKQRLRARFTELEARKERT